MLSQNTGFPFSTFTFNVFFSTLKFPKIDFKSLTDKLVCRPSFSIYENKLEEMRKMHNDRQGSYDLRATEQQQQHPNWDSNIGFYCVYRSINVCGQRNGKVFAGKTTDINNRYISFKRGANVEIAPLVLINHWLAFDH